MEIYIICAAYLPTSASVVCVFESISPETLANSTLGLVVKSGQQQPNLCSGAELTYRSRCQLRSTGPVSNLMKGWDYYLNKNRCSVSSFSNERNLVDNYLDSRLMQTSILFFGLVS